MKALGNCLGEVMCLFLLVLCSFLNHKDEMPQGILLSPHHRAAATAKFNKYRLTMQFSSLKLILRDQKESE